MKRTNTTGNPPIYSFSKLDNLSEAVYEAVREPLRELSKLELPENSYSDFMFREAAAERKLFHESMKGALVSGVQLVNVISAIVRDLESEAGRRLAIGKGGALLLEGDRKADWSLMDECKGPILPAMANDASWHARDSRFRQ